MKNKANLIISRFCNGDGKDSYSLKIKDKTSSSQFLEIEMSGEQLALAITGCLTEVDMTTRNLNVVGKKMHMRKFSFVIHESWMNRESLAKEMIDSYSFKGWKADGYFKSQDSFKHIQGSGYQLARTTLRSYLPKGEVPKIDDLPLSCLDENELHDINTFMAQNHNIELIKDRGIVRVIDTEGNHLKLDDVDFFNHVSVNDLYAKAEGLGS